MKRYAKIKADSNSKSRSMDLSADPQSFSTTIQYHDTTHHGQEFNQISSRSDFDDHSKNDDQEPEDDSKFGNGFGVKLTRSSSVSSNAASHQRFRKVKRAFSMRRSSSVSERYCRIHDQCVTIPSPTFDDNGGYAGETSSTSAEKINNTVKITSGKFLSVCKRFLRL